MPPRPRKPPAEPPKLKVTRRLISELIPDPTNARRHPVRNIESIRGSLRRFGQPKPIVVDGKGVVVAGNGTLEAAQAEGWTHIEVVVFDGTATEARAYGIADNRTAELATWDQGVLMELLDTLPPDLQVDTGFSAAEIVRFMATAEGGDTSPQLGSMEYRIIVECENEAQQKRLLAQLEAEGLECRAVMS